MADGKPWFYTIRKHRKKSIAAALFAGWLMSYGTNKYREYMIRRELCHEAKAFGDTTLPSLKKPRRLTLFFNPAAGSGSAETLLKKNAEPILHIAGLDVTIVKTEYEGQIKTLTQYIDPTTDGIVVAGGDGTLLEVVTGLLRRSDQEEITKIPIGLIPLGTHNSLCNRIFSNANVAEARTIGNAALAIVKGYIKPVDVMQIKGDEGRPTFALSKLHWGAFRDANEKQDKFWIVGPFRRKLSYVVAAIKNANSFLKVKLWPSDLTKTEFIENGWRMEKEEKAKPEEDDSSRHKCLMVKQLKLDPKDQELSWFSIDGEPFEAKSITISLLPNKLHFFFIPNKTQHS
ncbi:acylglycerol kinase, mitochondrial-like isoform X2 [Orbicella faveolata]|uniref:acylglycerol kinase, mitochondrial-like isoform X2 n=1 Tax=Orbicella faveolata TaxID=48498 RepID=UPI0009E4B09B|nr:acylglycerol kinase, mitochondrial-like isoform X2 [Orbicella faveolata]